MMKNRGRVKGRETLKVNARLKRKRLLRLKNLQTRREQSSSDRMAMPEEPVWCLKEEPGTLNKSMGGCRHLHKCRTNQDLV